MWPPARRSARSVPRSTRHSGRSPEPWDRADLVYVASLVGGIFGKGGGGEFANARWLQQLQRGSAQQRHRGLLRPARARTTAKPRPPRRRVPVRRPARRQPRPAGVAMPDLDGADVPGTRCRCRFQLSSMPGGLRTCPRRRGRRTDRRSLDLPFGELDLSSVGPGHDQRDGRRRGAHHHRSAAHGVRPTDRLLRPQLFTEEVLERSRHPGARRLLRRDPASSCSSARRRLRVVGDERQQRQRRHRGRAAVLDRRLPGDGGPRRTGSTASACRWTGGCTRRRRCPTPGRTEPPRQIRLEVLRTRHGIVQLRTTVRGRPVAIVTQRSTYHHEVDSVVGFARLNDPAQTHDAASFQRSAAHRLHVQLVLHRQPRHLLLQLRAAAPARQGHRLRPPAMGHGATTGRAGCRSTGTCTRPTRRRGSSRAGTTSRRRAGPPRTTCGGTARSTAAWPSATDPGRHRRQKISRAQLVGMSRRRPPSTRAEYRCRCCST